VTIKLGNDTTEPQFELDEGHAVAADEDLYRIGTVASLTGIAVERLRAWERRYGLTPAHRAGKIRFYNRDQLARLTKIKQLIDHGHPISSLVDLADETLDERIAALRSVAINPSKTGLIGPNLLVLEQQQEHARIDVQGRWANIDAFNQAQEGIGSLDTIVIQLPVLLIQHIETVEKNHPEARVVALYQFATPRQIALTQEHGVPTLQWPTSWQEIEHACATSAGRPLRASRAASRRFSDEELIAIAATMTSDESACPQHLVELISQLNAFAEYSLDYAGDTVEPLKYERIHTDATHARAQLELALEVFLEADQLPVTSN
jgi:DNA-binding transcriptional MerR regulator